MNTSLRITKPPYVLWLLSTIACAPGAPVGDGDLGDAESGDKAAADVCTTAAEGRVAALECPTGTVIGGISFASYGTPLGNCPSPSQGACHASTSRSAVETACQGRQACNVDVNNGTFGDPCQSTSKRLAVTYACTSPNGTRCARARERNTLSLSCPNGQVVSAIAFASYGTPGGSCPNLSNGACHAPTSQSAVEAACRNKQTCSLAVKNRVFGDPCAGVAKELAVAYACGDGQPTTGTDLCAMDPLKTEPGACGCGTPEGTCGNGDSRCVTAKESATASISCPSGQVIKAIPFASYGAPAGTCPDVSQGSCHSANSQATVQSLCVNRESCSVDANNGVFGDPCEGGEKKLAVKYTCGTVDTAGIQTAMAALTNHLNGAAVLSAPQIAAQKAIIDANPRAIGKSGATIAGAFGLVATYERVLGPLFMNAANANMTGEAWNPGFERAALKNDIHMAILNVMQAIVDHAYAGQNVALYESSLIGGSFKSSESWVIS